MGLRAAEVAEGVPPAPLWGPGGVAKMGGGLPLLYHWTAPCVRSRDYEDHTSFHKFSCSIGLCPEVL